jgi:hypothetical protein
LDSPRAINTSTSSSRGRSGAGRGARELLDQPLGDRGRDQRLAGGEGVDRGDELLGRSVLEQEAARASPQRLVDVLVEVECRQDQHRGRGLSVGEDPAGCLEPVQVGHLDVHQDDVGTAPARELDGVAPVDRLADDVEVGLQLEDGAKARADERLVVGDQHGDRHRGDATGWRRSRHHPAEACRDRSRG